MQYGPIILSCFLALSVIAVRAIIVSAIDDMNMAHLDGMPSGAQDTAALHATHAIMAFFVIVGGTFYSLISHYYAWTNNLPITW